MLNHGNNYRKINQRYNKNKSAGMNKRLLLASAVFILLLAAILLLQLPSRTEAGSFREKYYKSVELQPGDSLWSIAEEYGSKEYGSYKEYIEEVKEMNHLTSNRIYSGRSICIPYYAEKR